MSGFRSGSPKNILQQKLNDTSRETSNPSDEADRIAYGIISAVDFQSGQVKVKKLSADGKVGDEISNKFLPLATPLSEIHLLWGSLREGLVVRIYYRGKLNPKRAIIEVIGDEEHSFLTKEPALNEVNIGPYKIFGAGF